MLNFLTCIPTTFSKQAVKALARLCVCAWADSEVGLWVWTQTVRMRMGGFRGGPWGLDPPLKNHKTIGFSSNTGMDLLKNHKVTKPAVNVGPSLVRQSLPSSTKKKQQQKNVVKVGPPLTKLSGSAQNVQTRLSLH